MGRRPEKGIIRTEARRRLIERKYGSFYIPGAFWQMVSGVPIPKSYRALDEVPESIAQAGRGRWRANGEQRLQTDNKAGSKVKKESRKEETRGESESDSNSVSISSASGVESEEDIRIKEVCAAVKESRARYLTQTQNTYRLDQFDQEYQQRFKQEVTLSGAPGPSSEAEAVASKMAMGGKRRSIPIRKRERGEAG